MGEREKEAECRVERGVVFLDFETGRDKVGTYDVQMKMSGKGRYS